MDGTIRVRTVVGFAGGVFAAALALIVVLWAWQADAAPGDTDATFVPITPCRLIDTRVEFRVGPFGAFGANETKTIVAHGTNGECTIPADAVGLSLNVTALGATQPSFLTVWPDGARPEASSLNPVPGQPPIPNAVATNLSGVGDFRIYNLAGTVEVIVDVNGYYTKTSLQEIAARLGALEASTLALQAAQPFAVSTVEERDVGDLLGADYAEFVSVEVTAPVAGHVTLQSTAGVQSSLDTANAVCVLARRSDFPEDLTNAVSSPAVAQVWIPRVAGALDALTGSGIFDIDAGTTETFSLVCRGSVNASIEDRSLTAVFTPAL